jgi:type I restriction enzyme, R subunit
LAPEVAKRVEGSSEDQARAVAEAVVARARELCFPNWYAQPYMDTELYRELTIVLVDSFKDLELHGQGKNFVERCIRLLKKVRFVGEAEA